MIESYYYKEDLLKFASDFERRKAKQLWREDSLAKAEKQFFVGALFVRKLLESVKITTACKKESYIIHRGKIAPKQKITDFMRHKVIDYIEFAEWKTEKVAVVQICDKVIHSYVNYPCENDSGGLDGFILTTDKYRNKEIWRIPTETIVSMFNRFGNDYPIKVEMRRNLDGDIIYYSSE